MTKKQVGEEWIYLAHTCISLSVIGGSQEPGGRMQRPQRSAANLLVPHSLFILLPYRTQDHQPKDGTIHNGVGPSPQITNQ